MNYNTMNLCLNDAFSSADTIMKGAYGEVRGPVSIPDYRRCVIKRFDETNSPEGDPTREHNRHKAAYQKMSGKCKKYMTRPLYVNGRFTVQTHAASRNAERVSTLREFVDKFQHNTEAMDALSQEVTKALTCVLALGGSGVSHGNLHFGNILVVYTSVQQPKIKIVDWGGGGWGNNETMAKYVQRQLRKRKQKSQSHSSNPSKSNPKLYSR